MLYDPGVVHTVISKNTWTTIGSPTITPATPFCAYTNIQVETLGCAIVWVSAFNKRKKFQLHVVKEHDISLFGFDWCIAFNLPLRQGARICKVTLSDKANISDNKQIKKLLGKYKELFVTLWIQ